ncbi:MAG: hypothetical protein LPK80_02615 [Bacteroidota bacterium]|nr:hypothetical protein [Bacteroidota bacterium]MDX5447857.1 hypothetical protein [Bacteroidota bacterium]
MYKSVLRTLAITLCLFLFLGTATPTLAQNSSGAVQINLPVFPVPFQDTCRGEMIMLTGGQVHLTLNVVNLGASTFFLLHVNYQNVTAVGMSSGDVFNVQVNQLSKNYVSGTVQRVVVNYSMRMVGQGQAKNSIYHVFEEYEFDFSTFTFTQISFRVIRDSCK